MKNKDLSSWQIWKLNLQAWKINWHLRPGLFISIFLYALITSLSPYVTLWLSAKLIDLLIAGEDTHSIMNWVILILSTEVIIGLLKGIIEHWKNYEQELIYYYDQKVFSDKMMNLDYIDMDKQDVYDLYSQIQQNDNWNGWGFRKTIHFFEQIMLAFFQIAGGISLSINLFILPVTNTKYSMLNHPLFILFIISIILLISLISPLCAHKSQQYMIRYAKTAKFGNRLFQFYAFITKDRKRALDIRIYNQHQNIISDYLLNVEVFTLNSQIAKDAKGKMGIWKALSESLYMISISIIYLFVCLKSWAGAFGIGSMTQYIGAMTKLFLGIQQILIIVSDMKDNGEFLRVCFDFINIKNNMYQGSLTTEKRSDLHYEIEFKNVSFQYPDSHDYALKNINMKFNVGSRLAVVGMNGSGKTTFIKLLCRLYDPCEGEILLNGINIKKYRYDEYLDIFSIIFQDFQLLALPINQNIAVSKNIDEQKITDVCHKLELKGKWNQMPEGLDTYLYKDLSEKGLEISGGEAQKIAIARALYKDAPFIILDEPTAALDPISESQIYHQFDKIIGNKTAIYISHRLSSCQFCDEIIVFDKGKIIQQGTHQELLLDKDGKYYEMWHAQAQYYL